MFRRIALLIPLILSMTLGGCFIFPPDHHHDHEGGYHDGHDGWHDDRR